MAAKAAKKTEANEKKLTLTQAELEKIIQENSKKILASGRAEFDEVESKPAKYETIKSPKSEQEKFLNEKVPVCLVKDNNEYSEDVTVTFNGTNYQIKRGVTVMVPRFLKLVIDANNRQKMVAGDFADNLSKVFEYKTERVILGAKVESGLPL